MNYPKPRERVELEGNTGHRPLPEIAGFIPADVAIPEPPSHLQAPGLEAWNQIYTYCRAWVASAVDGFLIQSYCELKDERASYKALIQRQGALIDAGNGSDKAHPLIAKVREIDKLLLTMEGKLGLNPTDRVKLGIAIQQAQHKEEDQQNKRAKRERKAIETQEG